LAERQSADGFLTELRQPGEPKGTILRILYVYRDLKPGGLAVDIANMAAITSRGDGEAFVLTLEGDALESVPSASIVTVEPVLGSSLAARLGLATGVAKVFRRTRPSIVHAVSCLPSALEFEAMALAKRSHLPIVWTPMMHPGRSAMWQGGAQTALMRAFDATAPLISRWVDIVAAATSEEADSFRRMGVRDVRVIPPAVEDCWSGTYAEPSSSDHTIPSDPYVLAVAARLERRKGLQFGLNAMKRVIEDNPHVRFVIVGLPKESFTHRPAWVDLPGRVPQEDLQRLYGGAAAVFVPSLYEAFSRVVIEAWQASRPVVVSDGVGLASLVEQCGGGARVPYGDVDGAAMALGRLINEPGLASKQGKRGLSEVEGKFLTSVIERSLLGAYRELTAASRIR
jgi:glycosyltransferase involved in cell wall biosynthesis